MKSSFMLYILCMKISDPESRCYCDGRRKEILDSRLACASLHSLWIQIAPELPETTVIPAVRGLHRVKLEWGREKIEGRAEGTLRTRAEYAKDAKGIKKRDRFFPLLPLLPLRARTKMYVSSTIAPGDTGRIV